MDLDLYRHLLIPFLIFISRVADVSIGTVRIILVSKSYKFYAALLGFFEMLIWVVAIGALLDKVDSISTYIMYALGFSVGNYVGILIEEKIAIGNLLLQVIPKKSGESLLEVLREKGVRFYSLEAQAQQGSVNIIYLIVTRKNYKRIAKLIKNHDPGAFFTVEDINVVEEDLENVLEAGSKYRITGLLKKFKKKN